MRLLLFSFAGLLALTLLWPAISEALPGDDALGATTTAPAFFVDATSSSGIAAGTEPCVLDGERQYFVTGQAWGDPDGDGNADLFLTSQCGPSTLYSGDGKGHFQPSSLSPQVALPDKQSGGALFADLDGDGWDDLLVLTYDGPVLFHNQAGLGFVEVTSQAGLLAIEGAHPVSAALADYDQDGALDIFLANYGCVRCLASPRDEVPSQLLHNVGSGRFEDVSSLLNPDGVRGLSFVAGWGDFDNDGDPDLYVTNDVRGGRTLHGNALYRNDGPGCGAWCFTDVSLSSGAGVRADAMGLVIQDINGDGALDLFITNSGWAYTPLTGPSILLLNQGGGVFKDVSASARAEIDAMAWGAAALDADSDGRPDLYVALGTDPAKQGEWATTNRLLRNVGRDRFADLTRRSGAADTADSFGVAVGDANGDGQADMVVGDYGDGYRLFLGTGGGAVGRRLVVRLAGAGPVNHNAVGARIEALLSDGRRLVHEVSLGGTLGGNNDPAFRTGTGIATVAQLNVRWPDGYRQSLSDIPPDSELLWTYGSAPGSRSLPPVGAHSDLQLDPATSGLSTDTVMTLGAGLACMVLAALWLVSKLPVRAAAHVSGHSSLLRPSSVSSPQPRPSLSLRLRGRHYPVLLPSLKDPRLHVASVIVSLQVLGQTTLGFQVSIAQILVSLLTCALIELVITFRRTGAIAWPASALLTGNGVAFILRVPGTENGDWWALNGWYLFAGIAGLSLLSKYLVREDGRHVFNPSNLGLVLGFLLLGSGRVEPLDFWWGPLSPGLVAAYAIILAGGVLLLVRLHLVGMAVAFFATFAVSLGAIAMAGHCMSAKWSFDPVCGGAFWRTLLTSPETLVFMFFMMTDPRTIPGGRVARIAFGASVAFVAALLIAPQQNEFFTKVALLGSLSVVCALQLLAERFLPAANSERDSLGAQMSDLIRAGRFMGTTWYWPRLAARGALATVIAALSFAILVASGASARKPVSSLQPAETMVSRPVIDVDPAGLPAVAIDSAVVRLDGGMSLSRAAQIGLDVAVDLRIEAQARRRGDREMVKTAAAGRHLHDLWKQMDADGQTGKVTALEYVFDSMRLVAVYDAVNAQAGPQYGLEVRGRALNSTYDGERLIRQEMQPIERTFALLMKDGHFLIAADYPLPVS